MNTMNPGNLHKKSLILAGAIFTLVLFLMAQPVFAQAPYHSEQDFIDRSNHDRWIIDPAPKLLVDRQDIADNIALFQSYRLDINENFAWYSNETTITVQKDDTRVFAYRYNTSIFWQRFYPFFDEGVVLHVFEYNGTFFARPCGNFSFSILNPPPPKISGHKYNDRNESGTYDNGDTPLADWTIILYKDGVEIARTVTNTEGYYEFVLDARPKPTGLGVTPGTFTLAEVLKTGWRNTAKPEPVEVLPGFPGKNYANNDFLNFKPGIISGYKWNDLNHDGIWDPGELGLPDWEITLKDSSDNPITTDDFGNPLPNPVKTDAYGYYKFSKLPANTYTVHETLKPGWEQTWPPPPGYHTVPIGSGSIRSNRNFGNWKIPVPPKITGHKWEDVDGDGLWDSNEPALPDWEIILFKDDPAEIGRKRTDENGYYEFTLPLDFVGLYVLEETLPTGWRNTRRPDDISIAVTDEGRVFSDNDFGNFKFGKISGYKWEDKDKDGIKDPDEGFLSGWEIVLSKDGSEVARAITDENGYYEFTELDYGIYKVSEVLKLDWQQTHPLAPNHYTLLIESGSIHTDKNFGNLLPPPKISGHKWDDEDEDGVWDSGEPALPGWTIILFKEGVEVARAVTDQSGYYEFPDLTPALYGLEEDLPDGWVNTEKPSPIDAKGGKVYSGNDFGNFKLGKISGYKWNDLDRDGVWDSGEPPLEGWTINLAGTKTDTDITDASGYYEFTGLHYGTYTVSENLETGWTQIHPPLLGIYIVNVVSGTDSKNNNFGNFKPAKITGHKWDDLNENGVWDTGEPPLKDWTIILKKGGVEVDRKITDTNGYYEFVGLTPELYTLEEILQDGWVNTKTPDPVDVAPGETYNDRDFGNFKLGKISGYKWEDKDGDGVWDAEEPPLEDWVINLSGHKSDSDTTDATGYYEFTGLHYGTYTVAEVLKDGWIQTYPPRPGSHTINVVSGTDSKNNNFGNFKLGLKSGYKWNDLNENGVWDADEPPLEDWTIILSKDGVEIARKLTDENGYYEFTGLHYGTYTVSEVLKDGWIQTYPPPPGSHTINVISGTDSKNNNFGNFKLGRISGHKWNDLNENGVWDYDEPSLKDWTIILSKEGVEIARKLTDANGYYEFTGLHYGTYTVSEVLKDGWVQTYPKGPDYYTLSVISGSIFTDINFGNFKLGLKSGYKWNDLNENGVWDADEPPLEDWTIILSKDGVEIARKLTDENGYYEFTGLHYGTYTVSEVLKDGWVQTYPKDPAYYTFNIISGSVHTNNNFGNFKLGKISGHKFWDHNGNGQWDKGTEEPREGWTVVLFKDGAQIATATTDINGYYQFTGLHHGNYTVKEVVKKGWRQTKPSPPGTYTVEVKSGTDSTDNDFGNIRLGSIKGFVFYIKHCSGMKVGIPGVKITLRLGGRVIATTKTNSDGRYRFSNLVPNNTVINPEPHYDVTDSEQVKQAVVYEGKSTQVDFEPKRFAVFVDPLRGTKLVINYRDKQFKFYAPDYGWYPWVSDPAMNISSDPATINFRNTKIFLVGEASARMDYADMSFTDLVRAKWYQLYDPPLPSP